MVKAGINGNQDKVYDAFMQAAVGSYTFQGLTNFQNQVWEEYILKQPAPGLSLQQSQANFKKQQQGLFVQDTWQATERFSLTYGLRYDVPKFPDDPRFNPCFAAVPAKPSAPQVHNNSTLCSVAKGGFGFANNATPSGNGAIQPRVSFNYDFDTEYKTQLRGGLGIFVSDIPTVWYTNAYGNPGTTIVTYDVANTGNDAIGTLLCSTNGKNFTKAARLFVPGRPDLLREAGAGVQRAKSADPRLRHARARLERRADVGRHDRSELPAAADDPVCAGLRS